MVPNVLRKGVARHSNVDYRLNQSRSNIRNLSSQTLGFTGIAFENGASGYDGQLMDYSRIYEVALEKNIAFFTMLRYVEAALFFFGGNPQPDRYIQKG